MQHKLRLSREQVLEQLNAGVILAKSLCDDVQFSAEDTSRSDPDFLC